MRFLILRKADRDTEAGVMPSEAQLAAMGRYNEMLHEAGVLITGEGLRASAHGARVQFSGGMPVVSDGPFAETRELIAGFTMIRTDSLEEAIHWATRWPAMDGDGEVSLELRPLFELDDFAPGEALNLHARLGERLRRRPTLINPYLNFNGDCREAFEFYADCLDGHAEMLMNYGESPMANEVPPHWREKIIHACLRVGDWRLMGSDIAPDCYRRPTGFAVQLAVADPDRAGEIFHRLAGGGTVRMDLERTFWAERFGMLEDRFGIPWMINCEGRA